MNGSSQHIVILILGALLLAGCATNLTRGESRICEVHHTRMSKTTVPVQYGLIHFSERSIARFHAKTNAFPHADYWIPGGCLGPGPFLGRRAVIYTCDNCKTARKQWEYEYDFQNMHHLPNALWPGSR